MSIYKICLKYGFLFFLAPTFLSGQGVQFEHITWTEALAKAKAENKLVFVDAFTTWCGPCKMLSSKTFPDSSVGAFFNKNFINLKIDMEKGEGIQLAQQYAVQVYPTLLFVHPDGQMAHRAAGYYQPAEIITLGQTANDPERNLSALEKRYASGDRDRNLVRQLVVARGSAYDPRAGALANEYLDQEKDLNTPENKEIILRFVNDPTSKGFAFLVRNPGAFGPQITEDQIEVFVEQVFENYTTTNLNMQPQDVQNLYAACFPQRGDSTASAYRLTYYRERSKYEELARSATDHFRRFPSNSFEELNETAFLVAENVTDPTLLEQASMWAKRSISLKETVYNQFTLAKIEAKLGRKKEAVKATKRSIELAKAAGQDVAQMDKFLSDLEKRP